MFNLSTYQWKVFLATIALVLAAAPFLHSAWNYRRAKAVKGLPSEFAQRRHDQAFEWRGWKISFTALALIINTVINFIP
jgi:hypothetical protein